MGASKTIAAARRYDKLSHLFLSQSDYDLLSMPPALKVALVTGSGKRRIGWHVADALAKRGFALAVHYHHSAQEAAETVRTFHERGGQAEAFQADLADERAVAKMMEQALSRFGRLDVLVNCAAVWQNQKLEEVTAADVRHSFEVNTLGTFLCSRHAGLVMTAQPEGGNIITVGDWAIARPYLNYASYFVSKGAIPAMTRSLAVELGTRNPNVRVNCILPGPVMLPPDMPQAERHRAIEATLVKREGRPENVAQAVLFLLDNDFVTGVCLPVDGGRSILRRIRHFRVKPKKRSDSWSDPFFQLGDNPLFVHVVRKELPDDVVGIQVHRVRAKDAAADWPARPGVAAAIDHIKAHLRTIAARLINFPSDLVLIFQVGKFSSFRLRSTMVDLHTNRDGFFHW